MPLATSVEIALREELKGIAQDIENLNVKRTAILNVLGLYDSSPETSTQIQEEEDESDQPIENKMGSQLNTIDMARIVIRNSGRPLQPAQIKDSIKSTFGIDPAKTLYDMLWKRARQGDKGFYKDSEGNIGLLEMVPKLETVATISNEPPLTQ